MRVGSTEELAELELERLLDEMSSTSRRQRNNTSSTSSTAPLESYSPHSDSTQSTRTTIRSIATIATATSLDSNSSAISDHHDRLPKLTTKPVSSFVTPPPSPRFASFPSTFPRSPAALLMPRSPLKTSPRELSYLVDALEAGPDGLDGKSASRFGSPHSSPRSSTRAEALRRDIENTAMRLRDGNAIGGGKLTAVNLSSLSPPVPKLYNLTEDNSSSLGSQSNSPLPKPALNYSRTASTRSNTMSARNSNAREKNRRTESREWTQVCWMFVNEKEKKESTRLSKSDKEKKEPSRAKGTKRDSSQQNNLLSSFDMLMDDDNETALPSLPLGKVPPIVVGPYHYNLAKGGGSWKKVMAILKGDGYLRLFDNESTATTPAILISIHLSSAQQADLRLAEPGLFGRAEVICINRKSTVTPHTPSSTNPVFSSPFEIIQPYDSPPRASGIRGDESIYLCFDSFERASSFLVLMKCFAKPERLIESEFYDDLEDEDESVQSRVHRRLILTVDEGRRIGEWGTTSSVAPTNSLHLAQSKISFSESISLNQSNVKSSRGGGNVVSTRDRGPEVGGQSTHSTFVEVVIGGDVVARGSIKKSTNSPIYREYFVFEGLPPFDRVDIRVYQAHKGVRAALLGTATVRTNELEKDLKIENFWPIIPVGFNYQGIDKKSVGELQMSVMMQEQVVLSSIEYQPLLEILKADDKALLTLDLGSSFPNAIENITAALLRIYIIESKLLARIFLLIEYDISRATTESSQALLFRGNTITTKLIESYFRLIGSEFLEASIGNLVRQIVKEKVSIELDPSKFKGREKLSSNLAEMNKWLSLIWASIYNQRESCPKDFRLIFQRIQILTTANPTSTKAMRCTSVGAFLILRFIVPALLRPAAFNITTSPPSPAIIRTLTLLAKSIQGMANFTTFGKKEEFMAVMNEFVLGARETFIDYVNYVATPATSGRFDWTSPHASIYLAPNRLRSSLPTSAKDSVPQLPHLIDINQSLGQLASIVSNTAIHPNSIAQSPLFVTFVEECTKVTIRAKMRSEAALELSRRSEESIDPLSRESNTWPRDSPSRPTFETIYSLPTEAESMDRIVPSRRNSTKSYKFGTSNREREKEEIKFGLAQQEPDPSYPFLSRPSPSRRSINSPTSSPPLSRDSSSQSNNSFSKFTNSYTTLKRNVSGSSSKANSIRSSRSATSTLESITGSPTTQRVRPTTITRFDPRDVEALKDLKTPGEGRSNLFARFLGGKEV